MFRVTYIMVCYRELIDTFDEIYFGNQVTSVAVGDFQVKTETSLSASSDPNNSLRTRFVSWYNKENLVPLLLKLINTIP